MKKVSVVVTMATLYVVFYHLTPFINVSDPVIIALYLFSPVVVLYMTYVILKYGKPSRNNFDERFYDDWDYIRNGKEEMNPV